MKSESDKLYAGKKKKSFFKDEEQRNLWVRLNAEHIRYAHKIVNNVDKQDLGSIDTPYSHLWVSNNQLNYDEYMQDQPRMSLEELATMNHNDLLGLSEKRNRKLIKEIFSDVFEEDDDFIIFGEDEDFN